MSLQGHHTALILGIVAGVLVAFFRKGSQTGDGVPFSGR